MINDKNDSLNCYVAYTKGDDKTPRGYYKVYSYYKLGCLNDFLPWGLNSKNLILRAKRFSNKRFMELTKDFN